MTPRRESGVLFKVFVVSRLVARLLDDEVAAVPADQLGLFSAIAVWQPLTPTELAGRTGVKPTTLSSVLRRLEEDGLIVKTPNPADGRSYLVSLARAGRALWKRTGPDLARAIARTEAAIGDELEEVMGSLETLESAVRALLGEGRLARV